MKHDSASRRVAIEGSPMALRHQTFTRVKVSLCIAGFIPEELRNILCRPVEISTSTPNAHGIGTQPSPDLKAHAGRGNGRHAFRQTNPEDLATT
jgi:hypothetical protein